MIKISLFKVNQNILIYKNQIKRSNCKVSEITVAKQECV